MIVLLVGPSGVGKTSAYKAVEGRFPSCRFHHLDGLASRRALDLGFLAREDVQELRRRIGDDHLFLGFGLEALGAEHARRPGVPLVVDVGAGFQHPTSAERLPLIHATVAITADPVTAHQRWRLRPGNQAPLAAYMADEFQPHRLRMYALCRCTIDTTGQNLEQTAADLAAALRGLLPAGVGAP